MPAVPVYARRRARAHVEGPKRQVMLSPCYRRVGGANSLLAQGLRGVSAGLIFYQIKYDSLTFGAPTKPVSVSISILRR